MIAPTRLRIATRGSALARAQTDLAAAALAGVGTDTDVVLIETKGDRDQTSPVEELSGQGWFTGELEAALLGGSADLAVHSAKDLPSRLGDGLAVAAYLARADVRDALVSASGRMLADLAPGTRVGTSSPRRAAFAREVNPGIDIVPMRGNVDTRLGKLDAGIVDALLLACAGIDRLGRSERITERLDPARFIPAPAQGAIAIEGAVGSAATATAMTVGDELTAQQVTAERAVLTGLGGGCLLPLGAWARMEDGDFVVCAALEHAGTVRRAEVRGSVDEARALGMAVAAALL